MHARPAGLLVKEAKKYDSKIVIKKETKTVEVTKLIAIMGLGVKCGQDVEVEISGSDEITAYKELKAFFEVHQMMLEDEDYLDAIHNMIRTEMVSAEYAVAVTGDNFSKMFTNMDDDYMKARAADVKDISSRIIQNLLGEDEEYLVDNEPSIIVAEDISPSETVQLDKEKILGFVTVHGSTNSHTAILARMMNIPALIGVPMKLDYLHSGMLAMVDGFSGEVVFELSEETCNFAKKRIKEEEEKAQLLKTLK